MSTISATLYGEIKRKEDEKNVDKNTKQTKTDK